MERAKILNVWRSKPLKLEYFEEFEPKYKNGDFAIYEQFTNSHLYTYKNIAINQLVGFNKAYLDALATNTRPTDNMMYLFDRAQEAKQIGIELLTPKTI